MTKKKKCHQLLNPHANRKIPKIPKEYFERKHVPPPYNYDGKPENKTHYRYKVLLGEYLRDNMPFLKIDYEWKGLPSFFDVRYNRFINYQPDIFVTWHDDRSKISYFSDIEINGLIHYKSREQIRKVIQRVNHVFPLLQVMNEIGKEDYKIIASYMIIDKDAFEYHPIKEMYDAVRLDILNGGLYPKDVIKSLQYMLNIAK